MPVPVLYTLYIFNPDNNSIKVDIIIISILNVGKLSHRAGR